MKPTISLFGAMPSLIPSNLGNCVGGISLGSWQSNTDRIGYLTAKLRCNANEIGLYYNRNSAMSADETANWATISPPVGGISSATPFSGAAGVGSATPTNDAAQFAVDLTQNAATFFPARVKCIIISADPFFLDNGQALVNAANNWIAHDPNNRYVCYPLQDYQNFTGSPPTPQKSTVYGPSLQTAFRLLGFLAKNAIENGDAGFFTASNVINDLV